MSIRLAQPTEIAAAIAAGGDLIDVRTPAEFAAGHAAGARNLPLDRLDPAAVAALRRGGPLHVICQAGSRSRTACERLAAAGVADLVDVAGGTSAWKAAGLPMAGSGGSVFGVERQVRTIIGAGVLAGAVLAATVHPAWIWLSGFFGAGLIFAGLTNICALATLVAMMPWNRSLAASAAPAAGVACCTGK